MTGTHTQDLTLLLLFKDEFPSSAQIATSEDEVVNPHGFLLVEPSTTITQHLEVANKIKADLGADSDNPSLPARTCVWGWWRKPWENCEAVLQQFKIACESGKYPEVLLYNQYLRRVYKAQLYDIHFSPGATYIRPPEQWLIRCPEYYRNNARLSGAFFLLEILDPPRPDNEHWTQDEPLSFDPNDIFSRYFVDESSFPLLETEFESVVQPPTGISQLCRRLINCAPTPFELKACEHTLFVLRRASTAEIAFDLLNEKNLSDDLLADCLSRLGWSEIRDLLLATSFRTWSELHNLEKTMAVIWKASNRTVLRFDLFLVSRFLSHDVLRWHDDAGKEIFKSLREWVLAGAASTRTAFAATFFVKVWNLISLRYGLRRDIAEYFNALPHLEEIAYSTQYGLKNKFYRDHLSHNIRAALLACNVTSEAGYVQASDHPNLLLVSFLGGLLHDIAHPLASYKKISNAIYETFDSTFGRLSLKLLRPQPLVESEGLIRDLLGFVSLIASFPQLEDLQKEGILTQWLGRNEFIRKADIVLLYEELICVFSGDHAILGAIIMVASYLQGNRADRPLSESLTTLLKESFGVDSRPEMREFILLLQCMALHDRRASVRAHGNTDEQINVPLPLSFDQFRLPAIINLTDELQEWGRPIANYDSTLIIDCRITFSNQKIFVSYSYDFNNSAIGESQYSFLEHLFSKIRTLSQMRSSSNETQGIVIEACIADGLFLQSGISEVPEIIASASSFADWPHSKKQCVSFRPDGNDLFWAVGHSVLDSSGGGVRIRDFILITVGDAVCDADLISHLRKTSTTMRLETLRFISGIGSGEDPSMARVEIELDGIRITGHVQHFKFFTIERMNLPRSIEEAIDVKAPVSILHIEADSITPSKSAERASLKIIESAHMSPRPHFLDSDWRFTRRSAKSIIRYLTTQPHIKRICYLGCPTLALYHSAEAEASIEFTLFDRGHTAILSWLNHGYIKEACVVSYDVQDEIPACHLHSWDAVVMDPPWYPEHYKAFWLRAMQLLKREGGLLGIAEYPGYKDSKRLDLVESRRAVIKDEALKDLSASIILSYDIPDFERTWSKHKAFLHPALGVYRPSIMDFYRMGAEVDFLAPNVNAVNGKNFDKTYDLGSGRFMKYQSRFEKDLGSNKYIFSIRHSISHDESLEEAMQTVFAWTTDNIVAIPISEGSSSSDKNVVAGPFDGIAEFVATILKISDQLVGETDEDL